MGDLEGPRRDYTMLWWDIEDLSACAEWVIWAVLKTPYRTWLLCHLGLHTYIHTYIYTHTYIQKIRTHIYVHTIYIFMENLLFLRRRGLPVSRQPACGHERLHLRKKVPWTLHLWAWTHCSLLAGAHWPPCTGYTSGQKGGSVGFQLKANFRKNSRLTTQESRSSPYVETECHTRTESQYVPCKLWTGPCLQVC